MTRLTLYHTAGCHLCEEAQALLAACLAAQGVAPACLRLADIAEDGALLERYGTLIPVLREEDSGRELNWPFGLDDIRGVL
jgi:hypothetical protein